MAVRKSPTPTARHRHRNEIHLFVSTRSVLHHDQMVIAYLIQDGFGHDLEVSAAMAGDLSEIAAAYLAVAKGLTACIGYLPRVVRCFSKNRLLIQQVNRGWRIQDFQLEILHASAIGVARAFPSVTFEHVPPDVPSQRRVDQFADEFRGAATY